MEPDAQPPHPPHPLRVVAVTGCDGSGKSTLVASLAARLAADGPTATLYLGQSSGKIAANLRALPLIGRVVSRFLVRKAGKVHAEAKAPGGATAIAVYLLSCWRACKFRHMLVLARRGTLVVTDRYPQAEVAGFHFDGPELPKHPAATRLSRWLGAREQRLYQRMASHVPMLVVRLNVDADTAHARKPDHKLAVLRAKIDVLPRLRFNGARILDLDGRTAPDAVLARALAATRAAMAGTAP